MRELEFIRDHVTFKLPYDFSYHMKTPHNLFQYISFELYIYLTPKIFRPPYGPFLTQWIFNFSRAEVMTRRHQMRLIHEWTWIKFIYSEKATQFWEISTLLLSTVHTIHTDKSQVEIFQNFVAFSEIYELYMRSEFPCFTKFFTVFPHIPSFPGNYFFFIWKSNGHST